MKITINNAVRKVVPELELFFDVVQVRDIRRRSSSLDLKHLRDLTLDEREKASYREFRNKVAGNDLLAVERLKSYQSIADLPAPDPLTSIVIQASYHTDIPITVFSIDEFSSVKLRFSTKGDCLRTKQGDIHIKPHSLIADTDKGILGVLGIKSSSRGRLTSTTQRVAILSFGCSRATSMKSKNLVERVVEGLETKQGEKI